MAKVFKLSGLARRRLPGEARGTSEPVLPAVVWCGNGRPPAADRACLHGIPYVLVSERGGVGWDLVPGCFPCGKAPESRLRRWLELDGSRAANAARAARAALAAGCERLRGVNGDEVLPDGAKREAPEGGRRPAPARSAGPSAARPCTRPPTSTGCRSGRW